MEARKLEMSIVLLVATMLWAGAAAQSSDCSSVLIGLSPCLNYITGNSSTPSSSCCSQLGTVVRSQSQCLCQLLNGGGSSLGININQTLAMALPGVCRVQTPPLSTCNAGSPTDSPAETPESPSKVQGQDQKMGQQQKMGHQKEVQSIYQNLWFSSLSLLELVLHSSELKK